MWCIADQNTLLQCAANKINFDDVLCTKPCFGDVPQTNFPKNRGGEDPSTVLRNDLRRISESKRPKRVARHASA